ncbi:hypothetical protein [Methanobrevibacter cuticularis]|nr:hypothetical protein [Methanobrevibacter cuticularis]
MFIKMGDKVYGIFKLKRDESNKIIKESLYIHSVDFSTIENIFSIEKNGFNNENHLIRELTKEEIEEHKIEVKN